MCFTEGYAQDIQKTKALSLPSMRFDSLQPTQTKTIPEKKNDSLFIKKGDTMGLDSIKPKESIQDIIIHDAKDYTIQNAKEETLDFIQ